MVEAGVSGLDVWVEGEPVRRGVRVQVTDDGLRVGHRTVPHGSIYWTSRRAGLLMVFAGDATLAVKGPRERLDALARRVDARAPGEGGRGRLPQGLTREVVLLTAGVAAVGTVAGTKVKGLRLAVFTRSGMHLLAERSSLPLRWPVERVEETAVERAGGTAKALLLERGPDRVRLLYLFPEERKTVIQLARGEGFSSGGDERRDEPDGGDGEVRTGGRGAATEAEGREAGGRPDGGEDEDGGVGVSADGEGPLEMFARGEVAPPLRAEMPTLHLAADALREGAREASGRLAGPAVERAELSPHFFETHFLELGEVALGPLLLRKSAAGSARDLSRAVEAMDAAELQEDTRAAVANASSRLVEVYERELRRLLSARRAPSRLEEEYGIDAEAAGEIRLRLQAPLERLIPRFHELEQRQADLLADLRAVEEGPPGGGREQIGEALEAWKEALRKVDRGFERAWHDLVDELVQLWGDTLLPRLEEVGGMRRRRVPEWVTLSIIGAVVLLAAAAVMIFVVW